MTVEVEQQDDGSFYDPDQLPIEIIPFYSPSYGGLEIYIKRGQKLVTALEWAFSDPGSINPPPVIRLDNDKAQALINKLWIQGYRPNTSLSGASQEGALRAHLEDMRQLAFEKLDVKKPGGDEVTGDKR